MSDDDRGENGVDGAQMIDGISTEVIDLFPNEEPSDETGNTTYDGDLDDDNVNETVDLGFTIERVAIGDMVWMDVDYDGIYESDTDMAMADVVVELYEAGDTPGEDDPVATEVTSPSGAFLFDELIEGEYFIHIPASEFAEGEPLEDKQSSIGNGGDDATDQDADENGVDGDHRTAGISSAVINLFPNEEPSDESSTADYPGELDDDNVNLTVDFAFEYERVAMGNVIFMDVDYDGLYDPTIDMGVDGVIVELYESGDVAGTDDPVVTAVTSAAGHYLFDELTAGNYYVHVPATEFAEGAPLEDRESAPGNGGDDTTDDNADENGVDGDQTTAGISSGIINLFPNKEPSDETGDSTYDGDLDDDNVNETVDLGFTLERVGIAVCVWMDVDNDGEFIKDNDMVIQGVQVELFDENQNPMTDTPIETTTTNEEGVFVFDQIEEGTYVTYIPSSEFETDMPMDGFQPMFAQAGFEPIGMGVSSDPITLYPNEQPTDDDEDKYDGELDDDNVDTDMDQGFEYQRVSIGNLVFLDQDENGSYEENMDSVLSGITIQLYEAGQIPGVDTPVLTEITDDDGHYLFDTILAKDYFIHIPAEEFSVGSALDFQRSASPEGGDDQVDDNADENGLNELDQGGVSSVVFNVIPNKEPVLESGTGSYRGILDDDNTNMSIDFGFVTRFFDLALIKNLHPNSPTPIIGGEVWYELQVTNQGTETAYDVVLADYVPSGLILNDPDWVMEGDTAFLTNVIDMIPAGNTVSVDIIFTISPSLPQGELVNNAEIYFASEIAGSGINASDNDSTPGSEDGSTQDPEDNDITDNLGSDDYDGSRICIVDYQVAAPRVEMSCQSQDAIDASFQEWLNQFVVFGCDHRGSFRDTPVAPDLCGGISEAIWELRDANDDVVMTQSSIFEVIADSVAPSCPSDWDITVPVGSGVCFVEPYADAEEAFEVNSSLSPDNCSDPADIIMTMNEQLDAAPACANGIFYESRTVTRTYSFTDACGNQSESCPQTITYEFGECQTLNTFGIVGVSGETSLVVPSGCDLPTITVTEVEQGVCGYAEYMWLVSTEEDLEGNPIIPTNLNLGTTWTIVEGENEAFLNPEAINQNTYFVRCARNFSCCIYGESNIVSFKIDESSTCPVDIDDEVQRFEDCDNPIILQSPTSDYFEAQQMIFITNREAIISNRSGERSNVTIDAKQGVLGRSGLEVLQGAALEIYLEGCKED